MMHHPSRLIPLLSLLLCVSESQAEQRPTAPSLVPYSGIWILDPAPLLSFSECQLMVRVDAQAGSIYRVLSCDEDKSQIEIQAVASYGENSQAGWAQTSGYRVETFPQKSSCLQRPSFVPSGSRYSFDHSLGPISGSSEPSLFMSSSIGKDIGDFRSGSTIPDLGKNKDCRGIVSRSKLPSQASNALLQQAARVCELTPDFKGAGCFTQIDTFVPAYEEDSL